MGQAPRRVLCLDDSKLSPLWMTQFWKQPSLQIYDYSSGVAIPAPTRPPASGAGVPRARRGELGVTSPLRASGPHESRGSALTAWGGPCPGVWAAGSVGTGRRWALSWALPCCCFVEESCVARKVTRFKGDSEAFSTCRGLCTPPPSRPGHAIPQGRPGSYQVVRVHPAPQPWPPLSAPVPAALPVTDTSCHWSHCGWPSGSGRHPTAACAGPSSVPPAGCSGPQQMDVRAVPGPCAPPSPPLGHTPGGRALAVPARLSAGRGCLPPALAVRLPRVSPPSQQV